MHLRKANKADFEDIMKLAKTHDFPFPDPDEMITAYVVEKDGKVVSFGCTKKHIELVFIPNLSGSKGNIVKSLKLLNEQAKQDAKFIGVKQAHVFTWFVGFKDILIKKFGYRLVKGDALVMDIKNG